MAEDDISWDLAELGRHFDRSVGVIRRLLQRAIGGECGDLAGRYESSSPVKERLDCRLGHGLESLRDVAHRAGESGRAKLRRTDRPAVGATS